MSAARPPSDAKATVVGGSVRGGGESPNGTDAARYAPYLVDDPAGRVLFGPVTGLNVLAILVEGQLAFAEDFFAFLDDPKDKAGWRYFVSTLCRWFRTHAANPELWTSPSGGDIREQWTTEHNRLATNLITAASRMSEKGFTEDDDFSYDGEDDPDVIFEDVMRATEPWLKDGPGIGSSARARKINTFFRARQKTLRWFGELDLADETVSYVALEGAARTEIQEVRRHLGEFDEPDTPDESTEPARKRPRVQ